MPPATAARNLAFLRRYAAMEMPPRAAAAAAAVDENAVRSGDMLGIVRLDGLDPLIMWGTGDKGGREGVGGHGWDWEGGRG